MRLDRSSGLFAWPQASQIQATSMEITKNKLAFEFENNRNSICILVMRVLA